MLGMATHRPITSVLWEAQTGLFLKFLSCQLSSRFSETLSQRNKVENNTTTHAHTHAHTTHTPCEHRHKYSPDERKDGEATQ